MKPNFGCDGDRRLRHLAALGPARGHCCSGKLLRAAGAPDGDVCRAAQRLSVAAEAGAAVEGCRAWQERPAALPWARASSGRVRPELSRRAPSRWAAASEGRCSWPRLSLLRRWGACWSWQSTAPITHSIAGGLPAAQRRAARPSARLQLAIRRAGERRPAAQRTTRLLRAAARIGWSRCAVCRVAMWPQSLYAASGDDPKRGEP